jgi:hypothetical protein
MSETWEEVEAKLDHFVRHFRPYLIDSYTNGVKQYGGNTDLMVVVDDRDAAGWRQEEAACRRVGDTRNAADAAKAAERAARHGSVGRSATIKAIPRYVFASYPEFADPAPLGQFRVVMMREGVVKIRTLPVT